jgi:tetratricopeptide (TPR) repeat protein
MCRGARHRSPCWWLLCAGAASVTLPVAGPSQPPSPAPRQAPAPPLATQNPSAPAGSAAPAESAASHPGASDTTSGQPAATPLTETPADLVAAGDREHAAMRAPAALDDYERAIALDSTDYEALYKAAREAVDLGEFERDATKRQHDFDTGLRFARRAAALNPSAPDGHFHVARALGREALSVGGRKRIQYAKEVRSEALAALAADPNHPGALHVLGVWNAEVMRLSGIERFIARNLLGGGILGTASWKEAVRDLEQAVDAEPTRIVHHLDLGKIYGDIGNKAKAREQFQLVISMPPTDYNDPRYKQDAERQLARL